MSAGAVVALELAWLEMKIFSKDIPVLSVNLNIRLLEPWAQEMWELPQDCHDRQSKGGDGLRKRFHAVLTT